ncbi:MAG: amino acid adenylation domain-containing protein, partial [Herpetosiphonaceae bacterium]|nr:amino acid adenylation domain-containing protein [Herpetosiphonaceae bacterium]
AMPLSFAQERLWVMYQLDPDSSLYNVPVVIHFGPAFDVAVEERVFREIISRHEILRTRFTTLDKQPVQVVDSSPTFQLPVIDLTRYPLSDQQAEAQKLVTAEARTPFNLTTGPLLRAVLLRLTQAHVLIINMHHIISDDWSPGVLVQEIGALHQSFSLGRPSPLPALPIQYIDFAIWQRERLQTSALAQQLAYWERQLGGSLPLLALPTDRPRQRIQAFHGARLARRMPATLLDAIKRLGSQEGATLFMTVLAAYNVLLQRYTSQDDLLIGTPITSRTRPELEGLIGCFINMLVLRTQLSADQSFRQLLHTVRQLALEAYANAEVPFERLVQVLRPERNPSYTPIFQAAYILQDPMEVRKKMPEQVVGYAEVDTGTSKFDLTLEIDEVEGELATAFVYSTDLFDEATISRMLGHLQTILELAVSNADQPLATIELVTSAERQQLLVEWNTTQTAFDRSALIHQAIEAHGTHRPADPALIYADQTFSYAELNRQSTQLAAYLQHLGVGPEALVGLCVERTPAMVIAILAIFKAGGIFLPLDPSHPSERLAFILQDAQPLVLLTTAALAAELPAAAPTVVCLDTDWEQIARQPSEPVTSRILPHNLAYMIYTSGTTGTPKAVMVTHHNLMNVLQASQQAFGFTAADIMPCIAPFSFDIFLFELLNPLLAGGTSVMLTRDQILDLPGLVADLAHMTVIHTVPSLMRQLINTLKVDGYTAKAGQTIRMIFIGGDLVPPDLLSDMREAFPQAQIHVLYGPTEATIICTSYLVPRTGALERHFIGRPLNNMAIRLYDPQQNLVPVGIPGEIYIGGDGVTRGYLHRPELTSEKFVLVDDRRWYRTGDLGRYQPNGTLEFLGRIDLQVKIRGFRIELGEIEAVLGQHPAVRETVVLAREDTPGDRRLAAYVVAQPGQEPPISALRAFLQAKLPEYMIPAAFVFLETLPLTRNGKVDRPALPMPQSTRDQLQSQFTAPATAVETLLAEVWAEILDRENIGVHDNFFELGGDSILSLQIVARMNQAGYQLLTKHIFQYQTIAELAQVVASAPMVLAEQGLVDGAAPLTPVQRWFFAQNLPNPHYFNSMPVLLDVPETLTSAQLAQIVAKLLIQHDALRLRFHRDGGQWLQTHTPPGDEVPLSCLDLSDLPSAEQDSLIESTAADRQTQLNISSGPTIWFELFQRGAGRTNRLLISAHHLIFDGISLRILLEDLQTAYQQLQQVQPIQWPLKTTSFKEWALALEQHATAESIQRQADYWLSGDQSAVYPLPVDVVDRANTEASSQMVVAQLDQAETQALLHELPAFYHARIDALLLTALAQTLGEWTYSQAVLIELESHGRDEELIENVNLSRTIGWFTSQYPVLLAWPGAVDHVEILKHIKEQLRQIPDHGIGYGLLRHMATDQAIAERLGSRMQAEVRFNYLGQFAQDSGEAVFSMLPPLEIPSRSPEGLRSHVLDIDAIVVNQQLWVRWTYSDQVHERSTIEGLAQSFIAALRALLQGPAQSSGTAYIPSDFPLANLDQQKLSAIMKKIR